MTTASRRRRTHDLDSGDAELISELIFTSGTEATPKAIMHTEQTANFSVRVAYSDMGITTDDVVWMPSPVGHSTGFNYGLRFALYHGLPLVLQDQWDGAAAVDLVLRERCSYTLAATTFLQDLTETARRSGVAPRFVALLRLWWRAGSAHRWSKRPPNKASSACASTARPKCWWARGTGRTRRSINGATPTAWP